MNKKIKKNKQINQKSKHTIRNNKLIIEINKQITHIMKLIIQNNKLKMKIKKLQRPNIIYKILQTKLKIRNNISIKKKNKISKLEE